MSSSFKRFVARRTATRIVATAVLLCSAVSCGVETTTPESLAATNANQLTIPIIGGLLNNLLFALTWKTPLTQDIPVSATVTATQGATLYIARTGTTVRIPAGAVDVPTTITMTALKGSVVAFDFKPAGTRFKVPLHVTQDFGLLQALLAKPQVVYFQNTSDVNELTKTVKASEYITSTLLGTSISFDISHFSGYAVAAGRDEQ